MLSKLVTPEVLQHNGCNMLYDGRFNQDNQYGAINWMDTHGYQAPSNMSTSGVESKGELFFKYFEPDSPYERIPFVDKVCSPIIMFGSNFQHSCFPKFTNFMICAPLMIPCLASIHKLNQVLNT